MVAQIDSEYVRLGIGKTVRRLASYAFFEGRPHTTKGQWFNPVVFTVLRILKGFPGSGEVYKPIFITGLGRSGTTILGVLLSLHPDVGFLNEPKAIWKLIDTRHDINGDYISKGGKFKFNTYDASYESKKYAQRIFSRYLKVVRANRLVDKYPELIFRVDYLLELFPEAKIIFISRNGSDAVHSIDLWSKRQGVLINGRTDDWWGRGDIKWKYLQDQIILENPEYSTIRKIATESLDHVNRAAIEWIVTMREGLKNIDAHTDSLIHVRYEQLTKSPDQELKSILDKCNLPYDRSVITYGKAKLYNNPAKDWPVLLPPIEELFKETMKQLNYQV